MGNRARRACRGRAHRLRPRPGVGPGEGHRLESPRGADDRGRPVRRQHRRLRVPQPGPAEHGHAARALRPLQEPAGGPNFYPFGEDVQYGINIDNDGDAKEDITYRFRFRNVTRNANTFLYNTGPINTLSDPDWNRPQLYSVTRIDHEKDGRRGDKKEDKKETVLAAISPRRLRTSARGRRPTTRP